MLSKAIGRGDEGQISERANVRIHLGWAVHSERKICPKTTPETAGQGKSEGSRCYSGGDHHGNVENVRKEGGGKDLRGLVGRSQKKAEASLGPLAPRRREGD